MNQEEALKVADEAVFNKTGDYLTDTQKLIFQESWDNKTYDEIADECHMSRQHIKNEGKDLWQILRDALGETVSKKNFRAPLERYQRRNSPQNPISQTLPVSSTSNSQAEAVNYTCKLEEFKIFNNVNFTILIDELNKLKTKIPDDKQPLEDSRILLQHLQQTLLNAFNLSPDIINLSEEEVKALKNYLYANHLIIQCKQASVRVSAATREGIEERMLLVPNN